MCVTAKLVELVLEKQFKGPCRVFIQMPLVRKDHLQFQAYPMSFISTHELCKVNTSTSWQKHWNNNTLRCKALKVLSDVPHTRATRFYWRVSPNSPVAGANLMGWFISCPSLIRCSHEPFLCKKQKQKTFLNINLRRHLDFNEYSWQALLQYWWTRPQSALAENIDEVLTVMQCLLMQCSL